MNELIGATCGDGFTIEEPIWDRPECGRYRGVSPDGNPVLFATSLPQREPAMDIARRLAFELELVAGLWTAGTLDGPTREVWALVEDEPPGRSLATWPPGSFDRTDALELGLRLLGLLDTAHDRGIVVGGLRPELLYLELRAGRPVLSGIAPRCHAFFAAARAAGHLGFEQIFEAPESFARPSGAASDVFSFGATLGWLISGRHPFGDRASRPDRMFERPGGWPDVDDEALRLCEEAIALDASSRPRASRLLKRLTKIAR